MERAKLITGEWRKTDNARRARFYALTDVGRERLAETERSWAALARGVQKVLRFA
jgi:PadR family transcriptional regulator, regulatory protein PadR